MTAPQRKRLLSIWTFGTLLTLLVLAADYAGRLAPLERALYDARVRYCQLAAKPATDKLLHVDIDDNALAQEGQWPWDRSRIAALIDELDRAGAKAIVLDILFSERKDPTLRQRDDGTLETIDGDQILADSMARAGNVILAASLSVKPPGDSDPVAVAMDNVLVRDLEMPARELAKHFEGDRSLPAFDKGRLSTEFLAARGRAMAVRIALELDRGAATADELAARLLPKSAASGRSNVGPVARQFRETYDIVLASRALRRFTIPTPPGAPVLINSSSGTLPIAKLSEAAASVAFVDYLPESDGVVRSIPLAVRYDGGILPQISLVAACLAMDVGPTNLRFGPNETIIPRPSGEIQIAAKAYPAGRFAGTQMFLDIPLLGKSSDGNLPWERMYDVPAHKEPKLRLSVMNILAAAQTRENFAGITARTLIRVYETLDPSRVEELVEAANEPSEQLQRRAREAVEEFAHQTEQLKQQTTPTDQEKTHLAALEALHRERAALTNFARDDFSDAKLAALRGKVEGRVVFVGSVATGAHDFVPNSIDPKCPGVYLHGAVFNAIMTGEFWRNAPRWITYALTALLGLLTTLAVAALDLPKAFASILFLAGGYAAVNGYLLFDRYNIIVGAAGPIVATGVVWSGVTLIQFIREIGERNRLTRRFRSYVDPTLVNYVIENPEQVRLEAHEMELTVVFTDLAGFTSLSEKLRAQSAKLLGEYMEAMVPLIRARRGYVNKFLGDGIMFFFGAPLDNPDHASDAVAAVLDMQKALGPFNDGLIRQGLPTLSMRAGISTGMMVVGDAGPSFASDYTVLGDAVNFAARIESANKAFGTANLISARTAELVKDRYVTRPIANLLVVGKQESVIVHEAMAPIEGATEDQKRIAALTADLVIAFAACQFDACSTAIAELECLAGASKLTACYVEEIKVQRERGPDPAFCGQIQLFAK